MEILQKYNHTIRGFHNYYAIANNSSSLYNIRAVREERSNRHFTTKVSQEEKTEVGENIDNSTVVYHANRTSLIDRLKAEKCEICGVTGKLDMHHVRKLKALDGKGYADKLMIARRGKTIALC